MKIVVLVKRVVDTSSVFTIGENNKSIIENNFKYIINPYDEYAIEEALKIKETKGAEVAILSAGRTECKETIRTALAMGADYGVLIHDLASKAGKDLYALYIGKNISSQLEKLRGFGLKKVFAYEDEALEYYSNDSYVPIVEELVEDLKIAVIFGVASILGKELCASIAAKLGVEMVQECIDMDWNDGLIVRKPILCRKDYF